MPFLRLHLAKILIAGTLLVALLLVSNTVNEVFVSVSSKIACSVASADFCGRLTNKLARFTPMEAARMHLSNCTSNNAKESCLNASILFAKLADTLNLVKSLNHACGLGEKSACHQGNRVAQRYISEASVTDVKSRLQLALQLYTKGCEVGDGESCALAARSPLSSAKSTYSNLYRGCYALNHPTACIGMAEYFKSRGKRQLAKGAVSRICKSKQSLACLELTQRMSESNTAPTRLPSSSKYN